MTTTDKNATTDWRNVSFADYLDQVDAIMEVRYAMPSDERDVTGIAKRHEAGDTPQECVDWLSEEYDLEPLRVRTSDRTKRIAELNDQFRTTFTGGKILRTPGFERLTPEQRAKIIAKIMDFDDFTPDNEKHDLGTFTVPGVGKVVWTIDEVITRILTVTLHTDD